MEKGESSIALLGEGLSQIHSFKSVIGGVLWERVKLFVQIAFVWFLVKKPIVKNVILGGCFFTLGIYLMECIMLYGASGVGVCAISIFPHALCYALVFYFLFQMEPKNVYVMKKERAKRALSFLILLLLLMVGCFLESTVSVWLLQQFYACLRT